jgi:hypothetical protein
MKILFCRTKFKLKKDCYFFASNGRKMMAVTIFIKKLKNFMIFYMRFTTIKK